MTSLGLLLSVALLPDWLKTYLAILFLIATIVCVIGFLLSDDKKRGHDKPVNILGQISGSVAVAGRDAVQSIHHYHPEHPQPLGGRVDVWALRELKAHRDEGEKILREIHAGDGNSGSKWGEIDNWWIEAQEKAQRNVFSSCLTLGDLARFKEPWPEVDKLRACAMAIDKGQIANNGDDISLYQTHWERLERLRQLIGVIEAKG